MNIVCPVSEATLELTETWQDESRRLDPRLDSMHQLHAGFRCHVRQDVACAFDFHQYQHHEKGRSEPFSDSLREPTKLHCSHDTMPFSLLFHLQGIHDTRLLAMVGLLLLIDLIFLIVWQIFDPIRRKLVYDVPYRLKVPVCRTHDVFRTRSLSFSFSHSTITT